MINWTIDLYYRLFYGIRIYRNVLTREDRLFLFENCKKHLRQISPDHPGLQTYEKFHTTESSRQINLLREVMGVKTIKRCWVNYVDHELGYESWHTHNTKYTSVYYLKNLHSDGTIFKIKNKLVTIPLPSNSMIVFDGSIEHTAPPGTKKSRYSVVIDSDY